MNRMNSRSDVKLSKILLGLDSPSAYSAEEFGDPRDRAMFDTLLVMEAEGVPIDPITLADQMDRGGVRLDMDYLKRIVVAWKDTEKN